MQDALKRLRALQQELESLHRTTANVLAESERLIDQLQEPHVSGGYPKPRGKTPPKHKRAQPSARRAAKRPR